MKLFFALLCLLPALSAPAQTPAAGTIRGSVTLASSGATLHNASILLAPLGRILQSDEAGRFEFRNVPPGRYELVAHMHALSDVRKTVTLSAGGVAEVNFALALSAVKESITVTATGSAVTASEAFQTVTSRDGFELQTAAASTSLGDLLENETGVAKRSYGPGTSRPVVRGFDGDRVLVLQDGIPSGTLSSQSGDHGEPVDASAIERVEVVRGPATLLYGSNAIGGVVNVITQHHILEQHPHAGLHGHLSGVTGSANAQAGGSGGFEYGAGDWLLYGGGGGTRMGDYSTPLGKVENSFNYGRQTNLGGGHYSERFSFNLNYLLQDGRYGVPPAEDEHAAGDHPEDELVAIGWRRHNVRFSGAVRELNRALEQFQFSANYSDWNHRELHGDEVGTAFSNRQFSTRGTFTQRRQGPLSGNFGFWTLARDYKAVGEEALAPPAKQNGIAGFALEELSFERVKFQFGGRLEHNRYSPSGLRERSFTGASASAGVQAPLWRGGSAVFNYMHSYRAPALEELYNYGPHPGNNYYEIGNPNLKRELGNGVEVSLRHRSERMRFSANLFRYQMRDFVYFHTTGEEDHGLPVAHSAQADARFLGAESRLEGKLRDGLWLLLGFDAVDAQLTAARAPLPRIPPLRGRAGFDWRRGNLSVRPELVMSNRQWQLAPTETPTAGYAVANLNASYTLTGQHLMHMFQVNCFNLSNRLYRNHLSFIKEFAPEIGRGVRFSYSIQWF